MPGYSLTIILLPERPSSASEWAFEVPIRDVHTPIMAKANLIEKYQAKVKRMGIPEDPEFIQEGTAARGTPVGQNTGDRAKGQTIGMTRVRQKNPVYAAMIETMDDNVGRLMAKLDELGIAEDTLVVFTSDNGGHHITSNRPLRGCKGWLYEGGVREPWIVRWPSVTKPGSVCEVPVMNTDILPTVLEACGLPAKPDLHKDGVSFASLLRGDTQPVHDALFWHFPHYGNHGSGPCSSVRVGDWKLIHWIEDDSVELFNLATDLGEKTDLAAQQPDRVKDLRARTDAALNWCFQKDGSPRGEVAIRATVPGYSHRFKCVNHQGGNSVDVLSRLLKFMELAKKHDIYVILSDWEYMHTTWFVESEVLRNEVMAIPTPERLIHLARHMDRLVTRLKEKDLAGNIAWIEPANEADIAGLAGRDNLRWHTEAVACLRDRHPDILVSASLAMIDNVGTTDNSQVYDHHLYVGKAVYGDFCRTVRENTDNPCQNELLKKLLEPDITPYSAFRENFPFDDTGWITNFWGLYNVNIDKFDRWLAGNYQRDRASLMQNAADYYARHAEEARRRRLPMVVTEGGFFYSPLYSCFEESEAGLEYFDYLTDLAIRNGVWGFACSTYNGPEMPVWWARRKWLTETNNRFLEGIVKGNE